jgi:hypothetical protein
MERAARIHEEDEQEAKNQPGMIRQLYLTRRRSRIPWIYRVYHAPPRQGPFEGTGQYAARVRERRP